MDKSRPLIRKLGTIDCGIVETTPVVKSGRLYRFEYIRKRPYYEQNTTDDSYFRFIDVQTGEATPGFAKGYHLGSAHVEGDTVYVYGVPDWGASGIRVFCSEDMATWESEPALELPGWGIYNNSVCKGPDGYVMAIELGEPSEVVGVRFTMRFAASDDLIHWRLLPEEYVYSKDRYTACPAIRYEGGFYYMIYLEEMAGPVYEPHIVRSRDLLEWKPSPFNPVLRYSSDDKTIANPDLSPKQQDMISRSENINNSDVDLCEHRGRTIICYSWGDQQGTEFLAEAVYEGALKSFLEGFFP